MCIILSKPSGANMPDEKTLKNCWNGNKDGAGLSYCRAGSDEVHIVKGFMKFKNLIKSLNYHNFKPSDQVIIHFRFATHGLADRGNCHPFPLSSKTADLRATVSTCKIANAHNGIFGNMPDHNTLSDTQKFIGTILADKSIISNIDSKAQQELIRGYCGTSSKLAIMRPKGILHIGTFIEDAGIFYSNNGFKGFSFYTDSIGRGGSWQGHNSYDYSEYEKDDTCKLNYQGKIQEIGEIAENRIEGLEKSCILCGNHDETFYVDDAEGYLCDNCFEIHYVETRT